MSQITRDKLGFVVHIILTLHDLITNNPPTLSISSKRRESSPIPSYPLPRKPTSFNWPMDRRTPFLGFDGLYNNRRFSDFGLNNNWLPGASENRFISIDSRPSPNWNGNKLLKSWPTIRPTLISSTPVSQSPSSNPSSSRPAYDVSEFSSRTYDNPWYTLINKRSS